MGGRIRTNKNKQKAGHHDLGVGLCQYHSRPLHQHLHFSLSQRCQTTDSLALISQRRGAPTHARVCGPQPSGTAHTEWLRLVIMLPHG